MDWSDKKIILHDHSVILYDTLILNLIHAENTITGVNIHHLNLIWINISTLKVKRIIKTN